MCNIEEPPSAMVPSGQTRKTNTTVLFLGLLIVAVVAIPVTVINMNRSSAMARQHIERMAKTIGLRDYDDIQLMYTNYESMESPEYEYWICFLPTGSKSTLRQRLIKLADERDMTEIIESSVRVFETYGDIRVDSPLESYDYKIHHNDSARATVVVTRTGEWLKVDWFKW